MKEFIKEIEKAKEALEKANTYLEKPEVREWLIEEGYDIEHYIPYDYLTDLIVEG